MRLSVEDSEDEMSLEDVIILDQADQDEQHHEHAAQTASTTAFGFDGAMIEDIGLPVEQYKPRPSRSRSSQIPGTDWSVTPDNAPKKRKRRTMTDTDESTRNETLDSELLQQAREARRQDSSATKTASTVAKTSSSEAKPSSCASTIPWTAEDNEPQSTIPDPEPSLPDNLEEPTPQDKRIEIHLPPPDHTFATPSRPASATKRGPKSSKRSHTTIFEDHVGLDDRPDPSPNLHQQQATRKRGRGRPKKVQPEEAAPAPPATAEDHAEDDEDEDLLRPVEPPAKKRGRPPKVREPEVEIVQGAEKENTPAPEVNAIIAEEEPARKTPEEPIAAAAGPMPVHSPIKKSGGTQLRVGLSKRQRIQPLLRVLKR